MRATALVAGLVGWALTACGATESRGTLSAMQARPHVVARRDETLSAHVVSCRDLRYSAGADTGEDRPAHVRAGSGIAWFGGALAVVQDDASFVALVRGEQVDVVALPRGPGGVRLFDTGRGNKRDKLDLESVFVDPEGPTLVCVGSGSTSARERFALVRDRRAHLVPATALYQAMRAEIAFSGSELNIEGAALVGGVLRFFQRGNGAPTEELPALDASCDVDWAALRRHLSDGGPLPSLTRITRYELGAIDDVRLTFTDATAMPDGRVLYLAGAEASANTYDDGEIRGAALGVIDDGEARYTILADEAGRPLRVKAEGLTLDPERPGTAYVVLDPDDFAAATTLCELRLEGFGA